MTENPSAAPDPLALATQMVKSGRLEEAQAILVRYLAGHPASEQAWLLMSYVVKDPAQQKDCLERVLRLNTGNLVARSKLAQIVKSAPGGAPRAMETPPAAKEPPAEPPRMDQHPPAQAAPPEITPPPDREKTNVANRPPSKPAAPAAQPPVPVSGKGISAKDGSNRAELISRIAIIMLIVVVAGILLTVGYFGVVSPLLTTTTSTPTEAPTVEIVFTLPPAWTPTETATVTPTATVTSTATPTATAAPEPAETNTP